jgi:hypothetical protein
MTWPNRLGERTGREKVARGERTGRKGACVEGSVTIGQGIVVVRREQQVSIEASKSVRVERWQEGEREREGGFKRRGGRSSSRERRREGPSEGLLCRKREGLERGSSADRETAGDSDGVIAWRMMLRSEERWQGAGGAKSNLSNLRAAAAVTGPPRIGD